MSEIVAFNTLNLLTSSENYRIPIYQRNYAWTEAEIVQLILDVKDFSENKNKQPYYIGTLVVHHQLLEGKSVYDTIDGQQRLTTLNILFAVIRNEWGNKDTAINDKLSGFEKINLSFESRNKSTVALKCCYEKGTFNVDSAYNPNIRAAYDIISKKIASEFKTRSTQRSFFNYLCENVILVRVEVPQKTDLNHYFEVMNSRGEQLEKHEVLKAELLNYLEDIEDKDEREKIACIFDDIWMGCADMEHYIQYTFNKNYRAKIFNNHWDGLIVNTLDELLSIYDDRNSEVDIDSVRKVENLSDILSSVRDIQVNETKEDDKPDRFSSIINFPNFLLHVLKIQINNEYKIKDEVILDDKFLLKSFEFLKAWKSEDRVEFVKTFCYNLLKCRFLFDKYIIKREASNGKEEWSLKTLYFYSEKSQSYIGSFTATENVKHVILLLSMFHTVTPNMSYKNWFCATLNFLFANSWNGQIVDVDYIFYLQRLARCFVFEIQLAVAPLNYKDVLFKKLTNKRIAIKSIDWNKTKYENIEHNLLFNYIDYLYLQLKKGDNAYGLKIKEFKDFCKDFEFTYRTSIEHYYPQNPKEGQPIMKASCLNSIGNLCLISHHKNSSMNNYMPVAKKEHYKIEKMADSVKQFVMFNEYNALEWNADAVIEHEKKIKALLFSQL